MKTIRDETGQSIHGSGRVQDVEKSQISLFIVWCDSPRWYITARTVTITKPIANHHSIDPHFFQQIWSMKFDQNTEKGLPEHKTVGKFELSPWGSPKLTHVLALSKLFLLVKILMALPVSKPLEANPKFSGLHTFPYQCRNFSLSTLFVQSVIVRTFVNFKSTYICRAFRSLFGVYFSLCSV